MRESVCHNCPDRQVPKTCEATCERRQREIEKREAERYQRRLDNMVYCNKRMDDYVRQEHAQYKHGRK